MAIRATSKQIAALADGKRAKKKHKRLPKRTQFVRESCADGVWTIPVRVVSESNHRSHWTKKKRRMDEQKQAVFLSMFLSPTLRKIRESRRGRVVRVTFTRLGGNRIDVSNLPTAFKAVEDEVARLLEMDDGGLQWHPVFEQEPGRGPVGIRIRIEVAS